MGQWESNIRRKNIILYDSITLDDYSIVPNSEILRLNDKVIIPQSNYKIDYSSGILLLKNNKLKGQSAFISYRVFPTKFSKQYPENPPVYSDTLPETIYLAKPWVKPTTNTENEHSKLNVSGNISRGLNLGNDQNMVVNSNLNLHLDGDLAKGLKIEAIMSDKNIPVQPDGHTQEIQEFDQIYIRIYDSIRSLKMGDIEIAENSSHFLKFNRKILGANFTHKHFNITDKTNGNTQLSAAISRGNYNKTELLAQEGIQGPYKLKGANNENYIVILAGTEKVYLDGLLQQRGENADYVINYNTAELTFTPKNYISTNSRIIVEFEYSDRNYSRFLLYNKTSIKHKKNEFTIQYFTEGDAKNQNLNQELTAEQKQILANAGANTNDALAPNFDSVAFDRNLILYKMVDSIINNILYDSILVHSNNSDSAFYSAGFAVVGDNMGNYIQSTSAANGKVFKWVAPQNGMPQGNYEPVQILIAPEKKQMLVAISKIQLHKNTHAIVEMALAEKNHNTFSSKPGAQQKGIAFKSIIDHNLPLNKQFVNINISYELAQEQFKPIERYKNIEFSRDWNLSNPIISDEHYLQSSISLNKKNKKTAELKFEHLNYRVLYKGYKTSAFTNLKFKKYELTANTSLLNSKSETNYTQFYRHSLNLSRVLWNLKLGVKQNFENNELKLNQSDSLLMNSEGFNSTELFISNANNTKNTFFLSYKNRLNFLPSNNKLTAISEANDIRFNGYIKGSKHQKLKGSIIWRTLQIKNKEISTIKNNEKNLLAQIDHSLASRKNFLKFYTFYEIGTGLENRKEFSYIEVAPGQGIYVWIDYNNNNSPELNEFEISPFPEEANYLRIYTPTNDFIKVYTLKLNETINLNLAKIWRKQKGVKGFLAKFSSTFSFKAIQKHSENKLSSKINPIPGFINDTAQLNRNITLRNTLSFNRSNPKFGMDYTYHTQNSKLLQNNGFDARETKLHLIKLRWNITPEIMLINNLKQQSRLFESEYFSNKNFNIKSNELETNIQWQPTLRFRLSANFEIKSKTNRWGVENGLLKIIGPTLKINMPKQGMVTAKALFITNTYKGDLNSPVSYTILEGYQPGDNYNWSVSYARNINNYLRANLSYTGRKPAGLTVIHSGMLSVSAYF